MEELRNSQSYIDAYAKYIKTGKDKEIRALLTANAIALEGTTQIPVPEFVYDTVKTAWEDSELLRYVRKLYVKGNLKVGFEISSSGAEVHPEGGDPIQEEQLQIGVVELVPEMIKKYVMLSDELEAMASRDFLMYVYDELTHQIALKLETEIINAITNQPVGVTVPEVVNYGTNPKPETIAMSLSKLCAEAKNPVAIMNRGTWGEFKKAQYEANYPIDVFEKLTVIFSDALKSFADASVNDPYLIVGDFENGFLMNYPEGDEIRIKRDDITLATQDLVRYVGRVYCAMGVIAPRHFVTVNKGDEVTPIVPSGNIEITENTAEGEPLDISQYATATVNVAGGGGIVPIKSIDNVSILSVEMDGQYVLPLKLSSNNELPGFSNLLVTVDDDTFVLYPSISNASVRYNPARVIDYSAILYYQEEAPAGFYWYLFTDDETPTAHTVSVEILNPETAILLGNSDEVSSVPVDKYNNAWGIQLNSATNITSQVNCNFDSETGLLTLNKRYAYIAGGIQ